MQGAQLPTLLPLEREEIRLNRHKKEGLWVIIRI
jgi:hypothetical protein